MRSPFRQVLLLILLAFYPATVLGQAEGEPLVDLQLRGSPLLSGEPAARIDATVTLAAPAELRLRVVDFDGRTVRELFSGRHAPGSLVRTWRGRDGDGQRVPDGPYRIVATASEAGMTERADEWVTLAQREVYPRRPHFISVAVDPGHGGSFDGAVAKDSTREADLNLDIALRLARMLEGAGVDVVLTRSTDSNVNEPPRDLTGDGIIDATDELAARPDLANRARADVFISVHNNIAVDESVSGPSTFYFDDRPFGDRSARLARIVQEEMVAAQRGIGAGDPEPYDHGALIYPYYVLRGYDPPRLRRPTQMPGVLSEGMFLSNERDLRLLERPAVRQAMAVAYYNAIARYLSVRGAHVGYDLVSGPERPVGIGEVAFYEVEVRNQGSEAMRGWELTAGALPAPSSYIGRIRNGEAVGERRIPHLPAGDKTIVTLEVTAPGPGGEWMLLFDARDGDGRRASRMGSPMLQVPLTTVDESVSSPQPSASTTP